MKEDSKSIIQIALASIPPALSDGNGIFFLHQTLFTQGEIDSPKKCATNNRRDEFCACERRDGFSSKIRSPEKERICFDKSLSDASEMTELGRTELIWCLGQSQ